MSDGFGTAILKYVDFTESTHEWSGDFSYVVHYSIHQLHAKTWLAVTFFWATAENDVRIFLKISVKFVEI